VAPIQSRRPAQVAHIQPECVCSLALRLSVSDFLVVFLYIVSVHLHLFCLATVFAVGLRSGPAYRIVPFKLVLSVSAPLGLLASGAQEFDDTDWLLAQDHKTLSVRIEPRSFSTRPTSLGPALLRIRWWIVQLNVWHSATSGVHAIQAVYALKHERSRDVTTRYWFAPIRGDTSDAKAQVEAIRLLKGEHIHKVTGVFDNSLLSLSVSTSRRLVYHFGQPPDAQSRESLLRSSTASSVSPRVFEFNVPRVAVYSRPALSRGVLAFSGQLNAFGRLQCLRVHFHTPSTPRVYPALLGGGAFAASRTQPSDVHSSRVVYFEVTLDSTPSPLLAVTAGDSKQSDQERILRPLIVVRKPVGAPPKKKNEKKKQDSAPPPKKERGHRLANRFADSVPQTEIVRAAASLPDPHSGVDDTFVGFGGQYLCPVGSSRVAERTSLQWVSDLPEPGFGSPLRLGDVLGCGLDVDRGELFYTRYVTSL
jgi:hypothetical protein